MALYNFIHLYLKTVKTFFIYLYAKVLVEELRTRKYDPDPVRIWKKQQNKRMGLEDEAEEAPEETEEGPAKIGDYDYLLDMPRCSLTYEKKEELLRKKKAKMQEYEILRKKTPADLWRDDLDHFLEVLQDVEDAELEENTGKKAVKATGKVPLAKGRKKLVEEVLPSPKGQIVVTKIDPELRKKAGKPVIAKENKKKKKELKLSPEVERDSFDEIEDSNNKSL